MITIYKYPLKLVGYTTLEIPEDFSPLCVQTQNEMPVLWCEVNTDHDMVKANIVSVQTGDDIGKMNLEAKYLGTFQTYDGELVGHVYLLP